MFEFGDLWQLGRLQTHVLCLCSWHFHCSLLQGFPPLLQFHLQHVFLPCTHYHIIREHHPPRCFFLMFSVRESIMMVIRKGLKAGPWWKRVACSCSTHHYGFALMVHVFHQPDVLLWAHVSNTALPKGKGRVLFPNQWTHSVSLAVLLCIFFKPVLAQEKH